MGRLKSFPLRFWTGAEVKQLCNTVTTDTGVLLEPLDLVDRSIFVGRHLDTQEYGTHLPPLRKLVNRLFEHNVRTHLDQLSIEFRPVPNAHQLNEFFGVLTGLLEYGRQICSSAPRWITRGIGRDARLARLPASSPDGLDDARSHRR